MKTQQTTLMSVIAAALASIVAVTGASTSSPGQKGLEIALEVDRRDTGYEDQVVDLVMILRNSHGDETRRDLRTRTLEQEEDGDKALIIFDSPGDVRGTAFLSFTHKEGPDDQWLYLPALKRVKRIASNNKSGPFVGSEFAYEDLSSQEVEKYTYRYLGDEVLDGRDHFLVERDPVDPKSGYSRQIVWVDKEHYIPWKVEYYDRGEKLLKTLVFSGYNQYLGQYWRADRWEMTNHQTGKSTELLWSDYGFGNGFSDRDFNKNALAKAR